MFSGRLLCLHLLYTCYTHQTHKDRDTLNAFLYTVTGYSRDSITLYANRTLNDGLKELKTHIHTTQHFSAADGYFSFSINFLSFMTPDIRTVFTSIPL